MVLELSPHLRTGVPRIFFMDTNTSFASGVSGVIGEDTGGVESAHAPLAAAALENLKVAVMSTYDGYRKPEASLHSWYCNANSQWRSIDFIGTSEDISVQTGSCYAVDKFETCADNLDHRPVAQLFELRGVQRKPVTRRRCPQYSRDDVRAAIHGTDPKWLAAKLNFTVNMARCPTVSHLVETSSHRHIVVEHVVDGLVANFPANGSKKPFRKPHLSDTTKGLIRETAALSKTCIVYGRRIGMAWQRFSFRWWLAACSHIKRARRNPSVYFSLLIMCGVDLLGSPWLDRSVDTFPWLSSRAASNFAKCVSKCRLPQKRIGKRYCCSVLQIL